MKNNKKLKNSIFLVLAAFIWGVAFVAQRKGGDIVGPYSFNGVRSFIGAVTLAIVLVLINKKSGADKDTNKIKAINNKSDAIKGGIICGTILFFATTTQQLGLYYGSQAGKAGFITACYIILVPIFGILLKNKCSIVAFISVLLAIIGLYFLCISEKMSLQKSDILVGICAVFFAIHIHAVDYYSPRVNGIELSCIQFLVCGILSIVPIFVLDIKGSFSNIGQWLDSFSSIYAWIALLYAGVMSCGVAYTLQIIGQKEVNPTVASILMSLESVFSVIAGVAILGERISKRELIGCIVMFIAIIIVQLDFKSTKKI